MFTQPPIHNLRLLRTHAMIPGHGFLPSLLLLGIHSGGLLSRPLFSVLTILFLLSQLPSRAAVSVTAQLERSTVMAGEAAALTVIIEGGNPQSAETFPAVAGLTIQYRARSQNVTSVNGVASIKHLLNFSIATSQPGQFTIPSIKVTVDGAPYPTQPVALTVTKADPTVQNRYAFLRLNVPKSEVYVGEVFPIELQLYVVDAENLQAPQLKSDGFIIHKQPEHTRSQAQVGNVLYSVLTFKMSVSAAKAGKLALGPADMSLILRIRARPDPNDVFGLFGRYERRPMTVSSAPFELNVLPLPAPAPPGFTGAIGAFQWTVSASPISLAAGDPITLKITVGGRGNLDSVSLASFDWPHFKTYQPNSSTVSNDPLGMDGSRTFEQVIVPQSTALREIPSVNFAFFDPAKKDYVILAQPATAIEVRSGAPGQGQPAVAAVPAAGEDEPAERNDIVHIKSSAGPLVALAPPLLRQPWFLALQLLPLAGIVSVMLWRKRQDQLLSNPKLRRKLESQRVVATGLAELKALAAASDIEKFYALLFRLLQEQLGERLDLPASAITEAVLDERLPNRGASPEQVGELRQLFHICNQARYAPMRSDSEMLSVAANLEKALNHLQQLPD